MTTPELKTRVPAAPRGWLADHPISRRGFLQHSATSVALLAAGGCSGTGEEFYRSLLPTGERPEALAIREYAVLRAVAERLVPTTKTSPGASALGVAGRVDRELALASARLRSDFRDALRLVEWWPAVTRLSRFTRLAPARQDAELQAMLSSRVGVRRQAFQGIKFVTMFFSYAHPQSWPGIGYDGPWVPRGPADAPPAAAVLPEWGS